MPWLEGTLRLSSSHRVSESVRKGNDVTPNGLPEVTFNSLSLSVCGWSGDQQRNAVLTVDAISDYEIPY